MERSSEQDNYVAFVVTDDCAAVQQRFRETSKKTIKALVGGILLGHDSHRVSLDRPASRQGCQ